MSFGKNLKRLRQDKGWTQAQLGEHAGLKSTHIPKLENDTADPKLSTIYKLMSSLNASADTLLMDSEKIGLDGILKATLERTTNLPDINKRIIIELIDKYCIAIGLENNFTPENKTWFRIMSEGPDSALPNKEKEKLHSELGRNKP